MEKDLKTGVLKVLAYKTNRKCDKVTCGRPSEYYVLKEFICGKHFRKLKNKLQAKNTEIIFPSYQEPQFPRVVSNFLRAVNSRGHILGARWGYRLRQGVRRAKSQRKSRNLAVRKKDIDASLKETARKFASF